VLTASTRCGIISRMELLTQEIKAQLPKLYETDGDENKQVVCKFFNPMGRGTWFICEGEEQPSGDWTLFGLCDLGYGAEWGYVSLAELESVSLPFGLGIERDIYFQPKPATEVM